MQTGPAFQVFRETVLQPRRNEPVLPVYFRQVELARNGQFDSREGSPAVPFPPPIALAKGVSRSAYGRIFPLFSRVMGVGLLTGTFPRRPESVLSAPIFSRPVACVEMVKIHQVSDILELSGVPPRHFVVSLAWLGAVFEHELFNRPQT